MRARCDDIGCFARQADLGEVMAEACRIRNQHWGRRVTYSRKVFIALTNMCRERCGYCTFVKDPKLAAATILTPDQVIGLAEAGARAGCKELLFSLGEKPELRHEKARAGLARLGHTRMSEYLRAMCALAIEKTGLLPHVNAGTLSEEEIDFLRPVSASMGMMLESVSRRLTQPGMAHHACPDKVPIQRLRTLQRAGKKRVPFTTGILVGIGETPGERIESLKAIADMHRRYGHIQEVIIQNFRSKPGIAMARHREPSHEEMLRTIAAARLVLPPQISLQAPPNLSRRHIDYLAAGINDWGGISPVTIDFINPGHRWPHIESLAQSCADAGFVLEERLTVYPGFQKQADRFIARQMSGHIARLARADGLAALQSVA